MLGDSSKPVQVQYSRRRTAPVSLPRLLELSLGGDQETVIWDTGDRVSSVGELAQTISRNFSLQPDWFYWFAFLCPSSRKEAQLS